MKKSLIALAVVGAFAAQSAMAADGVNVYGTLDAAVASISNTGQKSQTLVVSGGLSASRFGVKASEDLGDGLKGIAQIEYGLDIANNSTIGAATTQSVTAREQMLGLSSASMGTVAAGYLQTTGYDFALKYDPTADSSISPLQNMTSGHPFLIGSAAVASRAQRALAYISPNMSGVTVAVNYVTALVGLGNLTVANTAADTNITATLASIGYDAGALSLGGVYGSTSNPLSTNNQKEYALGASYDLGVAKLSGTYQSTHQDTTGAASNNDHIYSLSGVVPVGGAGAVVLSYANAKIGTDVSGNSDGTAYTVGFLHPMSKTLTAYAAVSHVGNSSAGAFSVDNGAVVAPTQAVSASSNLVAVGLSKKF